MKLADFGKVGTLVDFEEWQMVIAVSTFHTAFLKQCPSCEDDDDGSSITSSSDSSSEEESTGATLEWFMAWLNEVVITLK